MGVQIKKRIKLFLLKPMEVIRSFIYLFFVAYQEKIEFSLQKKKKLLEVKIVEVIGSY